MKNIVCLLIIFALLINCFNVVVAEDINTKAVEFVAETDEGISSPGGGRTMTPEEFEKFRSKKPPIGKVRLNQKAIDDLQNSDNGGFVDLSKVDVAEMGDEIVIADKMAQDKTAAAFSLSASCDVSAKITFPPIGNQGTTSSCVSWAYGYYQASNNIANIRGLNAKNTNGGNIPTKNQMSPKWLYNLVNGGVDKGAYDSDAIDVLISYGSPSWYDLAGQTTTSNYNTWNPGAALWEKALENKFDDYDYITLVQYNGDTKVEGDFDSAGMENIKTLLTNGYVVSCHTDMKDISDNSGNWYTKKRKDPVSKATINELGCYYVKDLSNAYGHFITIVGYDDNVWIDVDGDNTVDSGEQGAFKIANSWGMTWANNGYVWLLYDALKGKTGIPGVSNQSGRRPAISNRSVFYLAPIKSYSPLLMAEVTLNSARRSQIGIEIGISPTTSTTPASTSELTYFYDTRTAFNFTNMHTDTRYRGESVNFTGGTSAIDGVFTFDLTPIVRYYAYSMTPNTPYRFYIKVIDNKSDSYSAILKSFRIIDRRNNSIVSSAVSLPLNANNSTVTAYANCNTLPMVATSYKTFNLQFNHPLQAGTLSASNVYVKDDSNNIVEGTSIYTSSDRKTYYLYSPNNGYARNQYYKLYIVPGMITDGGNKLPSQQAIDFYVP